MICGQKINSPSCVARKTAMTNGQKINLPSCAARKTAMICGQKTDFLSLARMHKDSNVAILVSRRSLCHICGKVIIASQTELPFNYKASMNNSLCFDYVKKYTLCGSNVEEGLIVRDLKKIQSVLKRIREEQGIENLLEILFTGFLNTHTFLQEHNSSPTCQRTKSLVTSNALSNL